MVKLKDMKNPDNCSHNKIAMETIQIYNIPQGYKKLMQQEIDAPAIIDMENYKEDDTIQNITRCLECGKELDRSPDY